MLLEAAGRKPAGPRAAEAESLPSPYNLCPHAASTIDAAFTGVRQEDLHLLCSWLLDGDDGAPLQPSKSPNSLQPALSIAVAPPRDQRSPPVAQPQTPFSVTAPGAGLTHVSPFAVAAAPAPLFTAPRSGSGAPPSPVRAGDRALSFVAIWCARAEAEGIQCLPPPSSSSWQQLVASGSLSGALVHSRQSLPPLPSGPTACPSTTRASSAPASCRRCGTASEHKVPAKRRRTDANHQALSWMEVQQLR